MQGAVRAATPPPRCSTACLRQYIGLPWRLLERRRPARAGLLGAALLATSWGLGGAAEAATYPLPPAGEDLVGRLGEAVIRPGETLLDVARRHDLGLEELRAANPGVDPWLPKPGRRVVLPTRYVLPPGPREGIVINLPELRLYYFPPPRPDGRRVVVTYPVGIGAEGKGIPLGRTRVVAKRRDPPWVVPASIREEHARDGDPLPPVVPPGPDNPLGRYALRLGFPGYLIHGTNRPFSVGLRVSHGCLRLYPEDIEALYRRVPVGTPVRILDRPYKLGWSGGTLYLEAHPPLEENRRRGLSLTPLVRTVLARVEGSVPEGLWEELLGAAQAARGLPVPLLASRGLRPRRGGWLLQAGAFRDPEAARREAARVRALGEGVPVRLAREGGWCRVLVGPYPDRPAATQAQRRLAGRGVQNQLLPAAEGGGEDCAP